jgi:Fe-S-cluster containining protein
LPIRPKTARQPRTLPPLLADIDARVQSIRLGRPEWLCGKGCDNCCRHLAEPPRLTAAEWSLLQQGLTALAAEHLQEISQRVAVLAEQDSRPVVCPLLDQRSGACPVYAYRPVACRTYGFYVQRELGLYCAEIEADVAAGALAGVVWGNHDAIDRRLAGLGESRALTEWFAGRELER